MSDEEEILGLDLEYLEWQDLALCQDMETNLFYDEYESNEAVAHMVDEACLSCPVMEQCFWRGVENGEWGVWGGVFLTGGRPDKAKNAHKSAATKKQIVERIGAKSIF